MATDNQVKSQAFQFPTTTPVPDEVFDVLMPQLSGAELKVLLYICRRTFGFNKESDTISLHQIATGITTRDGRVLDGGTGLCIPSVTAAVRSLEEKGIIVREKRKSVEKGCEATIYSLKFAPPLKNLRGGSSKNEEGGLQKFKTQQTVVQETVIQETDNVVDVAQDLENFGIAKLAAARLMQDYPAQYIREKLAMAQGLVGAGSSLVSQNPAGWLRKAIEEDYSPPRTSERHRQPSGREKKDARRAQAELRATSDVAGEQHITKKESQQVKEEAPLNGAETIEQPVEQYQPQPVGEDGLTTASLWEQTLKQLRTQVPAETYETRLKGTMLLQLTDIAARILVPSASALAWLERRLYQQIHTALEGVLGRDLDLQFIAAS